VTCTPKEPPFLIAQLIVLALFIALTILAAIRFRTEPLVSEARIGTPAGEMR
jgi:hypothetical protein